MRRVIPYRPRLADHVHARRHLTDGIDRVVLDDFDRRDTIEMSTEEWDVLALADGTRDLDGVILAAYQRGNGTTPSTIRELFTFLATSEMLSDGIDEAGASGGERPPEIPPETPLDILPGYRFHCNGSGLCCSVYPSVLFAPVEALRARVLRPDVLRGAEGIFLPERGSVRLGDFAVSMADGRCVYLDPDGLCGIHKAGGSDAKPYGCSQFPRTSAYDGETVRISVRPECACVFASSRGTAGEELLPPTWTTAGDLDGVVFTRLADEIGVAHGGQKASRSELVAWSRVVFEHLSGAPEGRTPETTAALAAAIRHEGLAQAAAIAAIEKPGAPPLDRWGTFAEALVARSEEAIATDDWRSGSDRARHAVRWIREAARLLVADDARAEAAVDSRWASDEAFYLRAGVHGHHFVQTRPLASVLDERAFRLVVARVLSGVIPPESGDARCPLAIVEVAMRALSIGTYLDRIGEL